MRGRDEFLETDVCVASDFRVNLPGLNEAITYLVGLGSKYSIEPHVTLLLSPSSDQIYAKAKPELLHYLEKISPFEVTISNLAYENKSRFVKVEISSGNVYEIHKDLLKIMDKYRKHEIRAKDMERMISGKYTEDEIEHLYRYGFLFSGERFQSKLTIGVIPEGSHEAEVFETVKNLVKPSMEKKYLVTEINLMFHTDAATQSEMKVLDWESVRLSDPMASSKEDHTRD